MTRPYVIVGLSGGVDSSVAALLLQQQGYRVEGLFMKNWEEDDDQDYCAAAADLADARAVCEKLGIPLHTINFSAEYWERVFSHFLAEYSAGRTPNPDILCNKEIKFRAFLDHALQLGADAIATGHYARVDAVDGIYRLRKGLDPDKDQSYFLYTLQQEQLSRTLFPVGELRKSEVRSLAQEHGLVTHDKKDSTGICFIGERRFKDFLARYLPACPGDMRTPDGELVGHHDGLMYYTLGQRQGLGIGGRKEHGEAPWYVVDKELERNVLVVAQGHDHPRLFSSALEAGQLHWVAGRPPAAPHPCHGKVRYRQGDQPCTITALNAERCQVSFAQAQRAVTPGQSVVFYDDDVCLGGGIIEQTTPAFPD
jgi:tRNA-specific 2-thiouridylase